MSKITSNVDKISDMPDGNYYLLFTWVKVIIIIIIIANIACTYHVTAIMLLYLEFFINTHDICNIYISCMRLSNLL